MKSLTVVALLVAGCLESPPLQPDDPKDRLYAWIPDSSSTILHTGESKLGNPTLAVIGDRAAWRSQWSQVWGGPEIGPPLPEFDFVLSSVVVVGLGTRAGLGYSVTIDSIVVYARRAVLFGTQVSPGARCGTAAGTSAPVHLVHVSGHPPITEWLIGTNRQECASD